MRSSQPKSEPGHEAHGRSHLRRGEQSQASQDAHKLEVGPTLLLLFLLSHKSPHLSLCGHRRN